MKSSRSSNSNENHVRLLNKPNSTKNSNNSFNNNYTTNNTTAILNSSIDIKTKNKELFSKLKEKIVNNNVISSQLMKKTLAELDRKKKKIKAIEMELLSSSLLFKNNNDITVNRIVNQETNINSIHNLINSREKLKDVNLNLNNQNKNLINNNNSSTINQLSTNSNSELNSNNYVSILRQNKICNSNFKLSTYQEANNILKKSLDKLQSSK
jgi:hypothetical protein